MERPRLADFESRLGQAFTATTLDGQAAGTWTLAACMALPVPDLPRLAGRDCFSLTFHDAPAVPQATYQLVAPDGYFTMLFAVPVAPGVLHVTIN
jgi:hypothetical protein